MATKEIGLDSFCNSINTVRSLFDVISVSGSVVVMVVVVVVKNKLIHSKGNIIFWERRKSLMTYGKLKNLT